MFLFYRCEDEKDENALNLEAKLFGVPQTNLKRKVKTDRTKMRQLQLKGSFIKVLSYKFVPLMKKKSYELMY